jgi:phage shock protein PspC (stress-responsive transcriptional regulator)
MVPRTASDDASGMQTTAQTSSPNATPRRLHRSREDRMIGGVCGGLAEYFGIDPLIVRIGAVTLALAGGAGVPAYIAAWLLAPAAGSPTAGEQPAGGRADSTPVRVFNVVDAPAAR